MIIETEMKKPKTMLSEQKFYQKDENDDKEKTKQDFNKTNDNSKEITKMEECNNEMNQDDIKSQENKPQETISISDIEKYCKDFCEKYVKIDKTNFLNKHENRVTQLEKELSELKKQIKEVEKKTSKRINEIPNESTISKKIENQIETKIKESETKQLEREKCKEKLTAGGIKLLENRIPQLITDNTKDHFNTQNDKIEKLNDGMKSVEDDLLKMICRISRMK